MWTCVLEWRPRCCRGHLCVRSRGGLTLETCYLLTVEMWPYQLVWYWIFLTSFHSCSPCTIILGCHGSQFLSSPEWCHVQWTCDLDRKCSQFMPRNKVKLGSLRLQVPGWWCNFECSIKCNQEALGWKWAKGNFGQEYMSFGIRLIWYLKLEVACSEYKRKTKNISPFVYGTHDLWVL